MTSAAGIDPHPSAAGLHAAIFGHGGLHGLANSAPASRPELGQRLRDVMHRVGAVWSFELTTIDGIGPLSARLLDPDTR